MAHQKSQKRIITESIIKSSARGEKQFVKFEEVREDDSRTQNLPQVPKNKPITPTTIEVRGFVRGNVKGAKKMRGPITIWRSNIA